MNRHIDRFIAENAAPEARALHDAAFRRFAASQEPTEGSKEHLQKLMRLAEQRDAIAAYMKERDAQRAERVEMTQRIVAVAASVALVVALVAVAGIIAWLTGAL